MLSNAWFFKSSEFEVSHAFFVFHDNRPFCLLNIFFVTLILTTYFINPWHFIRPYFILRVSHKSLKSLPECLYNLTAETSEKFFHPFCYWRSKRIVARNVLSCSPVWKVDASVTHFLKWNLLITLSTSPVSTPLHLAASLTIYHFFRIFPYWNER